MPATWPSNGLVHPPPESLVVFDWARTGDDDIATTHLQWAFHPLAPIHYQLLPASNIPPLDFESESPSSVRTLSKATSPPRSEPLLLCAKENSDKDVIVGWGGRWEDEEHVGGVVNVGDEVKEGVMDAKVVPLLVAVVLRPLVHHPADRPACISSALAMLLDDLIPQPHLTA
ncbi:hypothetical protein BDQ17DRAFT_1546314 [Cyathus striatus]|nr:hypothetical protein BDQ17DRAFT_1546314 [Cyathus striatus]